MLYVAILQGTRPILKPLLICHLANPCAIHGQSKADLPDGSCKICSQIGLVICPYQTKCIVRTGSEFHILLVMDTVPGHSLILEI